MKKILYIAGLAFSMLLTACGSNAETQAETTAEVSSETEIETALQDVSETGETETDELTEESEENTDTADSSSVLIAYYSNTGNTAAVAEQIAELTGGTLAEIERTEAYGDLEAEAEPEILNGEHPEITVSVSDVQDYETIFVGYPIWWDEAPAMIATFLAENDFSGKTVIPFCTSASDDIGNSMHIFEELCPEAEIAEGFTANDESGIEPWLQKMGMIQE